MDFNDSYSNSFNNSQGGFLNADEPPAQVITKRVTKPITVGMLSWCKHYSLSGSNFEADAGDANKFSDTIIKYEDMELSNVVFTGFVKDLSIEVGFNTYRVEDGTGTFDIRKYKGDYIAVSNDQEENYENEEAEEEENKENTIDSAFRKKDLVKASGAVKLNGRNVIMNYLKIKKIDSYNEHLENLLEAAQQYAISKSLLNEYGGPKTGDSSTKKEDKKLFLDSSQPVHERVTHYMRTVRNQFSDGEGVPKRLIMENLGLDREAFESAVDHLAGQGIVYESSNEHLELSI